MQTRPSAQSVDWRQEPPEGASEAAELHAGSTDPPARATDTASVTDPAHARRVHFTHQIVTPFERPCSTAGWPPLSISPSPAAVPRACATARPTGLRAG